MERGRISLFQLSTQISDNLGAELKKMSTLALNITYSKQLKTTIKSHLSIVEQHEETESHKQHLYRNTVGIINIVEEITGPYKTVPQVNIILPDLYSIGSGLYSMIQPIQKNTAIILSSYNTTAGALFYSNLHGDMHANQQLKSSEYPLYISLFKTIFDEYHKPLGILEVMQYADTLFSDLSMIEERIMVFDKTGVQIYPTTVPMGSVYVDIADRKHRNTIINFTNPISGKHEMVAVTEIIEPGWVVLTITERSRYLLPLYKFIMIIVIISLIILGIGFLISAMLSRKITMPLKDLNHKISRLDWTETKSSADLDNKTPSLSLKEVDELHITFQAMNKKLDSTLSHIVAEKTLETQSRLLALQAQMDPHFIYNMLATLSIMAEDGETKEIVETINHMTSMLRYIADGSNTLSTLRKELEITEHYISCTKIRFGTRLQYTAEVSKEAETIPIPRHVILPIVENAVKYGMDDNPPWIITLNAEFIKDHTCDDGVSINARRQWRITIRDNGPGFKQKPLNKLLSSMELCRTDKRRQLDFHINGMGLINLYSRLLIHYGESLLFEVNNLPGGAGTEIRIGGFIGQLD